MMMKLLAVLVPLAILAGCRCPLLPSTVDRLEQSLDRQHRIYLRYVEADPKLTEPQKQIERDNAQSQRDLLREIKRAHGW